jgi:poly(3-hydroxybutyrate) depolymerase
MRLRRVVAIRSFTVVLFCGLLQARVVAATQAKTLEFGGHARSYLLRLPVHYDSNTCAAGRAGSAWRHAEPRERRAHAGNE